MRGLCPNHCCELRSGSRWSGLGRDSLMDQIAWFLADTSRYQTWRRIVVIYVQLLLACVNRLTSRCCPPFTHSVDPLFRHAKCLIGLPESCDFCALRLPVADPIPAIAYGING